MHIHCISTLHDHFRLATFWTNLFVFAQFLIVIGAWIESSHPMAHIGNISEDELNKYDGTDPEKPILVAIRGNIYDVSSGKSFYGPGGSYAVFSGKDASRALAKMSTKSEDVSADLDGLTEKEIQVLDDWDKKFKAKYPVVGHVAK